MAGKGFLVLGVAAAATALPSTSAFAHWGAHYWWGPRPWPLGGWGLWGWIHHIAAIGFWVLVVMGLALALRWLLRSPKGYRRASAALEIAKERYARGEISREEFERMRLDFTG